MGAGRSIDLKSRCSNTGSPRTMSGRGDEGRAPSGRLRARAACAYDENDGCCGVERDASPGSGEVGRPESTGSTGTTTAAATCSVERVAERRVSLRTRFGSEASPEREDEVR
jgi:hypothetical protein